MVKKEEVVILEVKELLVSATLKAGSYNKESYYGHAVVTPRESMIIKMPVSELGTKAAIEDVIKGLHEAVVAGVQSQIDGDSQAKVTVQESSGQEVEAVGALMGAGVEEGDEF